MSYLVIMRHGESVANQQNVFTGWNDVELTFKGVQQAHQAGRKVQNLGIKFDDAHTSFLKRAIETMHIVLGESHQLYVPEYKSWRLNERHYGALRGHNKADIKKRYGDNQFLAWRRSFDVVPPLLASIDHNRRYDKMGVDEPRGESLKMAYQRLMPYWQDQIVPRLLNNHNELIVAHGSTLRALMKYLDQISDEQINKLEIPNATPIIYHFDSQLQILNKTVI